MAWGQILPRSKKAEEKLIRKAFRAGYKRGREDERERAIDILDRVTNGNQFPSAQARALACSLRKRIQDTTFMGDGYKMEEKSLEPCPICKEMPEIRVSLNGGVIISCEGNGGHMIVAHRETMKEATERWKELSEQIREVQQRDG